MSVNLAPVSVCAAVGLLSYAAAWTMTRHASRLGFVDAPNERSLHAGLKPRAGGLGFAVLVPVATIVGTNLWIGPIPSAYVVFLMTATALALVSLADDRWGLSVTVRFVSHIVAAVVVVLAGAVLREIALPGNFTIALGAAAIPITIAWIVAVTNIYNFMDGSDGLAAGQAIVAATTMSIVAANANAPIVTLAMCVLAAGVLGFLVLNWPPARIFMGDVGSTFLGFTFAGWAVLSGGTRDAPLPFIAWIAVLSPFLFDAMLTMVRRVLRGERPHQAHRQHLYQRLVRAGWSHAAVAMLYIVLAAAAGALTVVHYVARPVPAILFLTLLASILAIPVLLAGRSRAA